MSLVWKVLIGAIGVLVLVSGATGLVAASSVESPAPRETIVVDTTGDEGRSPGKGGGQDDRNPQDGADDEEDPDVTDDGDIDSVRVEPDDLEDRTDDREDELDDERDDREDEREDERDDRDDD